MPEQVQVSIDREIFDRLQTLMVPPINDINGVIRELLVQEGHASRGAIALESAKKHYTYAQELERASQGVYECGGGT